MSESIVELCPEATTAPVCRGEKRRREIAAVAELVFFENGFTETTMQAIALRAGASKETLYRHFGSKEGLFAEIVEARANSFLDNLDENFERPGSVADVLRTLGLTMIESVLGNDAISLCRTVISEASRNPELGEIFFRRGPERVLKRLAEFLDAARERGELTCADPEVAARIFLGAVFQTYHLRQLCLQNPPRVPREHMRRQVAEATEMFLLKYAR